MNKKFAEELMSAYLDGEVTPAEQAQVERELAENPERQRLLEELRSMRAELQAAPVHRPPVGFADRVLREARRAQTIAPAIMPTGETITLVEPAAVIAASVSWKRRLALWGTVALAASLTAVLCYSQWNDPRGVAQRVDLSKDKTATEPQPAQRFETAAAPRSASRTDRGESNSPEEFAHAGASLDFAYDARGSQNATTSKAGTEPFDQPSDWRHDEREALERLQSLDDRISNRFSESAEGLEGADQRVDQSASGSPSAVRMRIARSSEAGEAGSKFYQAPQDFQKQRAIDGVTAAPANVFYRIARGRESAAEGRGAEGALGLQMGFGAAPSTDVDRAAGFGGAVRLSRKEPQVASAEELSKVLPKEATPAPTPGLEAAQVVADSDGEQRQESRAEQRKGGRKLGRSLAAGGFSGGMGGLGSGLGGALGDRAAMQAGEAASGEAAREQAGGMLGEPMAPVRTYYLDVTADAYAQGAVEKLLVENGIAKQDSLDLANAIAYSDDSLFGRAGDRFAVEEQVASDDGPVDSERDSRGQAESELGESSLAAGLEAPSDAPSPATEGDSVAENAPAAAIELSVADAKSANGVPTEQLYVLLTTPESLQSALAKFRETPGIAVEETKEPTSDQQQLVQDVASLHWAFSVPKSEQTEKLAELRVLEASPEDAPAKKESLTDELATEPAASEPAASEPAAAVPAATQPAAGEPTVAAPTATAETAVPEKLAQRRARADAAKPVVLPPPAPAQGKVSEEAAKDPYRGISPRAARPGGGPTPAAEFAVENERNPKQSRPPKASSEPRQEAAADDASSSPERTPETPPNPEASAAEVKQLGERDKTNSRSFAIAGKRDSIEGVREQVLIVVRVVEAADTKNAVASPPASSARPAAPQSSSPAPAP